MVTYEEHINNSIHCYIEYLTPYIFYYIEDVKERNSHPH